MYVHNFLSRKLYIDYIIAQFYIFCTQKKLTLFEKLDSILSLLIRVK